MPEGPSIVLLREQAAAFVGRTIVAAGGNTRLDLDRLPGRRIRALRSWGKLFLIELDGLTVRIHFLLFGSYRIDERKERPPRLSLRCEPGELNFYGCSVQFLDGDPETLFDWGADVMSERWDPQRAKARLRARPERLVCDVLLDQDIFSGVGNIIRNEVLFRIAVHPESRVGALPEDKLDELVGEARRYSFDFLDWKKAFVLKKHWLAHTKRVCPRCALPLSKTYPGTTRRRSFFCERCQIRYGGPDAA